MNFISNLKNSLAFKLILLLVMFGVGAKTLYEGYYIAKFMSEFEIPATEAFTDTERFEILFMDYAEAAAKYVKYKESGYESKLDNFYIKDEASSSSSQIFDYSNYYVGEPQNEFDGLNWRLNEHNHSFFYYIKNLETGEVYYNQSMEESVREKFGINTDTVQTIPKLMEEVLHAFPTFPFSLRYETKDSHYTTTFFNDIYRYQSLDYFFKEFKISTKDAEESADIFLPSHNLSIRRNAFINIMEYLEELVILTFQGNNQLYYDDEELLDQLFDEVEVMSTRSFLSYLNSRDIEEKISFFIKVLETASLKELNELILASDSYFSRGAIELESSSGTQSWYALIRNTYEDLIQKEYIADLSQPGESAEAMPASADYILYCYFDEGNIDGDFNILKIQFETLKADYDKAVSIVPVTILFFFLCLLFFSVVLGHKKGTEGIYLNRFDCLSMEVVLILFSLPFVCIAILAELSNLTNWIENDLINSTALPDYFMMMYAVLFLMVTILYATIIKRIKNRSFLKSFFCFRMLMLFSKLIIKFLKSCYRRTRSGFRRMKYNINDFFLDRRTAMQVIIVFGAFTIYETFFFLFSIDAGEYIFLTLLGMDAGEYIFLTLLGMLSGIALLGFFLFRMFSGLNHILQAAEKIAAGDLNTNISGERISRPMQSLARDINNIGNGLSWAVEDRLKSERLKTELITNVSHDIKTPLTSIITYVDLLKKEELNNETALSYIKILEEKSWRLKTLIEDLVEASKASTGNIILNVEKINLSELVKQASGEFEDRFAKRNLDLNLQLPEKSMMILADGRSTYRIIENLFSNIAKYTLSGTRVYIDAKTDAANAILTIKNISEHKLNVNTEELMERFVRGDTARNTEGNGLGLSIAKSLTDLQSGTFEIQIDGDLFKTIVTLPLLNETTISLPME